MNRLTSLLRDWIFDHRGPHHIIPRSRLTEALARKLQGENLYPISLWPPDSGKHSCWHLLFENMTADEAVDRISEFVNKDGSLDEEFFRVRFIVNVKSGKSNNGVKKAQIKTEKNFDKNREHERRWAWEVLFEKRNAREAIEWIDREFIRKEWQKN